MSQSFIRYDKDTGEIVSKGYSNVKTTGLIGGQYRELPGDADPVTQYVNVFTAKVVARPASPVVADKLEVAADTVDKVTLQNIVPNSNIDVEGVNGRNGAQVGNDIDNTVELTFDRPGTYTVKIRAFPEQDSEFVVTAT